MAGRLAVLIYGSISYVLFLGAFLYVIGFLANYGVPRSIDSGTEEAFGTSLAINLALLSVFAIQHSVMARPGFKRWWTGIIPQPIERSTYVMLSNLLVFVMFWQWRPMTESVWTVENTVGVYILWGLFAMGWAILLISTFLIDHFELFGLTQTVMYFRGKQVQPLVFRKRLFYKYVRHPLMVGWLVGFWSTPNMSVGHLVFSITTTLYILVAIQIEERDLLKMHGEDYEQYRRSVPMLLPFPRGN